MKFILYFEKVVIAYLIVICMSAMTSCTSATAETTPQSENLFSPEIERAIDVCYETSCIYLSHVYESEVRYDSTATDELKLFVIRKADIEDKGGDVLPEMDEYGVIEKILWPLGYGKY